MEDEQHNKAHKSRATGNKVARKDELRKKKLGIELEPNRGRNPKAFQGPSAHSHKSQQRVKSMEKKESALHLPSEDKTMAHLIQEPPLLVAVVGPPGVGKTTLIRSMVKFYAGRNLQSVRGPITVIAGKSRRVTFMECPNNLAAMCDIAKVADLILLMVDGNFGFEMETFEFLNIAQVHGFPKIFGVVSHLDQMKTSKALKKQKKFLRHRFWHEVAAGAKLLCLSPMHHNMYRPNDVLKLHRLLICVQTKIQSWRNTHSCVLIDRHEDLTNPDDVAADDRVNRSVAFYGYVRGKPMKPDQLVHIPGLGDFPISHLSRQEDPCVYDHPSKNSTSQGHRMRHLNQKQKRLYAPYCDIGGVTYDDDAIYIQEDADRQNVERSGDGLNLLRELQRVKPIDESLHSMNVIRRPVTFKDDDTLELEMDEVVVPEDSSDSDTGSDQSDRDLSKFGIAEEDGEEDFDDMPTAVAEYTFAPRSADSADAIRISTCRNDWSNELLLAKVKELFVTGSWKKVGEGNEDEGKESGGEERHHNKLEERGYDSNDEEFEREIRGEEAPGKKMSRKKKKKAAAAAFDNEMESDDDFDAPSEDDSGEDDDGEDISRADPLSQPQNALASITGTLHGATAVNNKTKKSKLAPLTNPSKFAAVGSDDEDDFDILKETEESLNASAFKDPDLQGLVAHFMNPTTSLSNAEGIEVLDHKARQHRQYVDAKEQEDEEALGAQITEGKELTEEQQKLLQKRMAKKKAFDENYDVDGSKNNTTSYYHHLQQEVKQKREELDNAMKDVGEDVEQRIRLVGFFSGLYVRFVIENVPVEFLKNFNPVTPLIAGGLNAGEDQLQMIHAKIKRHRWYPRILKAQDPMVISIGWRRIQTQPIFAQEDPNGRHRYLKYSPLHMHCYCAFYAPVAPTNTGFIAIPVPEVRAPHFRCLATGYTVGNDSCTSVVKKLKLTGTPQKVQKTTVFIKGLFNSDVEGAKFIGAKLKTVSGIRGMIKAVIKGKNGIVRATFEDKVLLSDIVFIRAWKPVDPPRFCTVVRNLVEPNWVGMRTMAQLRRDKGVPLEQKRDSEYKEIKRRRQVADDEPARVMLSRNTRLNLPFDMKEDFIPLPKKDIVREALAAATTVVQEPREIRKQALLDAFQDKADAMEKRKKEQKQIQRERTKREAEREDEEYSRKLKKAKKETARKQEFRTQHKVKK